MVEHVGRRADVVTWSKVLRSVRRSRLLYLTCTELSAHGSNCSQFPDEGPMLTLAEWDSPRSEKRDHEGGS